MLRTKASDDELSWLRQALQWMLAHKPEALTVLFTPRAGGRPVVSEPPAALLAPLVAFGLVERVAPSKIVGRRRLRVLDGRFYVLDLGLGDEVEYRQELWPETDALLARLDGLRVPSRILDLGTGSGIVAVEAAARGHSVVATDLFPTAVALARFNARLNGVGDRVELRTGWLWSAVPGERFELVLTNPHYGRVEDQLRLEVLRGAAEHLSPAGRLCLATVLEWETVDGRPRLGLHEVLAELGRAGLSVRVEPLVGEAKRDWFYEADAPTVAGLVSRHRFMIELVQPKPKPEPEPVPVPDQWPTDGPRRAFVPLSRLTLRSDAVPAHAALVDKADLTALSSVITALQAGELTWELAPRGLLDACRLGARVCVGPRGAAAAIVRGHEVRPCTAGGVIGAITDDTETLRQRLERLAEDAASRRGCAQCPAQTVCSRCLFPAPLDEASYCDWIRAHAEGLPLLARLWLTLAALDEAGATWGSLSVRTQADGTWRVGLGLGAEWLATLDDRGEARLRPL